VTSTGQPGYEPPSVSVCSIENNPTRSAMDTSHVIRHILHQSLLRGSMCDETEAMALAIIRLMHESTGGEAMQWRTLRQIDVDTDVAVALAVQRGWAIVDDNRGIALTEIGCQLAEELGRPLH
jgi:hypothetical protein